MSIAFMWFTAVGIARKQDGRMRLEPKMCICKALAALLSRRHSHKPSTGVLGTMMAY